MLGLLCSLLIMILALCAPLSAEQGPGSSASGGNAPGAEGRIVIAPDVTASAVATAADATSREKLAADELGAYLFQITGRRLERTEIPDGRVPAGVIAVGSLARECGLVSQKELEAVARDGYVVRVAGGRAGICGWRDLGTVYGAYALLGRLGVRFYAPGCEIVPKVASLLIPECELKAKPHYDWRGLTGNLKLGQSPDDDMGDPGEIGEPGSWVHSADFLVPFDKYSPEHPEYFALQKDGTRLHRDPKAHRFDVHLCLSNPEVRRISAERMLYLIGKQPNRTFFGVSQGDGSAWCECEQCRALDGVPGEEMTDRLLDYVNYVARAVGEKYPDKRILTLAYTFATSPPPRRVLPEPNVMVQFCPYPGRVDCQSHDLTCEQNARGLADLEGWLAKCPDNMYIFDYPCGYQNYYEPFGSFYAMKRKLDFYAEHGIRGIYYCGVPTSFRDLFIFVQSRLLWDPKADVEKLIDEFMGAYYGPAAPYMRQYFDYFHGEIERRNIHQMCEGPNPGFVTAEFSQKGLALIAEAEAAAAGNGAILSRIWADKFCLLFADVNERNLGNGKIADSEDAFARRLAEFVRIARERAVRSIARRDSDAAVPSDWIYGIGRLRIDARPWYNDPVFDRLIADPEKTLRDERQRYAQRSIADGVEIELVGFSGGIGPKQYYYQCEPKRAVWVRGRNTGNAEMRAVFHLDEAPQGAARLGMEGQDDDASGSARVRISVNGAAVFEGPNGFAERGWSRQEFPVPAGVLRQGDNELRISNFEDGDDRWFMVSECRLLLR